MIAGGGTLPHRLVEACQERGRPVYVLAIKGHAAAQIVAGVEHGWVRLGAVGRALDLLHRAGVEEVVMAGPVGRPSLAELRPDLKAAATLARLGRHVFASDDGLLKAVVHLLEREGFRVIGAEDVLADLLAGAGTLGSRRPAPEDEADIALGVAVARALGAHDVGQAVVVQRGIVLGVEAVEGTDALLARCGQLRRPGPGGVLVKVRKPAQERRVDLPTIGRRTVEAAAEAGLVGVAAQAGGALMVDRDAIRSAADELGLFVVGIPVAE